jgi:hypothetical protein
MKPLQVFLLMIGAAVLGGVAVKLAQKPETPAIAAEPAPQAVGTAPVAAAVTVAADSAPTRAIRKSSAHRAHQPVSTAIPSPQQPTGTLWDVESAGIFSGVDPGDPRVFHFSEN